MEYFFIFLGVFSVVGFMGGLFKTKNNEHTQPQEGRENDQDTTEEDEDEDDDDDDDDLCPFCLSITCMGICDHDDD